MSRVNAGKTNPIQLRNMRMKYLDDSSHKLTELNLLLEQHPESSILRNMYNKEWRRNERLVKLLSE